MQISFDNENTFIQTKLFNLENTFMIVNYCNGKFKMIKIYSN